MEELFSYIRTWRSRIARILRQVEEIPFNWRPPALWYCQGQSQVRNTLVEKLQYGKQSFVWIRPNVISYQFIPPILAEIGSKYCHKRSISSTFMWKKNAKIRKITFFICRMTARHLVRKFLPVVRSTDTKLYQPRKLIMHAPFLCLKGQCHEKSFKTETVGV